MAMEAANLAGLSQAGAPVMVRGSRTRPTTVAASAATISRPVTVSGGLPRQSLFSTSGLLMNVSTVNINIGQRVDTVNMSGLRWRYMVRSTGNRPKKKRSGQYHHGDLQHALLEEALRLIQAEGVERLTLRGVGEKL